MSYEIFIARGIADIRYTTTSSRSSRHQSTHSATNDQPQTPCHHLQDSQAQAFDMTGGCWTPLYDQLGAMAYLEGSSATPTMTPEGHAQPGSGQVSPVARARGENFRTEVTGQKSETQPPLVTISEYRFNESLVPLQRWEISGDDQSPHHVSESSSPTTHKVPNAKILIESVQVLTGPVVQLPPPNLSDSSTKWTGSKVYRHATNSAIAFVDGNLDAPHLSGEYSSATRRSSKRTTSAAQNLFLLPSTHSTLTRLYIDNMSSSGIKSDAPDFLFTDPFLGLPLELERQASDISDLSSYIRPQAFSRHRDTLARVSWTRKDAKHHEDEGFQSDEDDEHPSFGDVDKNMTILRRRSSRCTTATCIPAEILHQIFSLLQPCDFEAARHACRSWFIASLDQRLGYAMLKRAGCYSAFLADLNRISQPPLYTDVTSGRQAQNTDAAVMVTTSKQETVHRHWLASKRLATEGRLSAAWHGSGLRADKGHSTSRLSVRQTIDFTHIMSRDAWQRTNASDTFTVSTCGKFVLVTSDCDIYVYSIDSERSTFQPLVRLVAESKVIAVSMDTSAHRFAVAALLEGRMGACWEIDDIVLNGAMGNLYSSLVRDTTGHEEHSSEAGLIPESSASPSTKRDEISIIAEGMDMDLPSSIQFQPLDSPQEWMTNLSGSSATSTTSSSTSSGPHSPEQSSLPTRFKPSAIYRNLGTKNDAPRSVAICPQRKCAAFGCRSGIELHWVDALTGADLNRWFPLAAPSDHLYFLPQRAGVDSAKKLRLISSATNPNVSSRKHQKHITLDPATGSVMSARARARSMTKLFHGNRRPSLMRSGTSGNAAQSSLPSSARAMDCDHYRAVPLSDGQHMLFTDPVTGFLCLGSDAPLGGPTKLVRKACMVPPHTEGVSQFEPPVYYTVASDLRWGVRIVAMYEDGRIVLYNIPSDCFERLRHIRSTPEMWDEWNNSAGQSDLMMDAFMLNRETAMANAGNGNGAIFKSLQIDGALLGHIDADVETIAIDSTGGGLQLWVFHASGQATQMDIYVPRNHQMSSQVVEPNGLIHEKPVSPLPRAILKTHTNTPYETEGHQGEDYFGSHVRFVGLDGCCDHRSGAMCGPMVHKNEIDFSDLPRDEGISMTPGVSDDEDNERPLQVELLTDWRAESLLRPYIVNVAWIDAH